MRLFTILLGLACLIHLPAASAAERVRLYVGNAEQATFIITRDLEKQIALPAGIDFEVRPTSGAPDILYKMREGRGVQWALIQADAIAAYQLAVAAGNAEAAGLIAPLRLIAPISQEDLYFFVRSDSPLNFIHEIRDARINLGEPRSGTALTAALLYRNLFGTPLPDTQASFRSHREALVKLTEKTVDVVALVAPRPAKILSDMKPEARGFVKLLKNDPTHAGSTALASLYAPTTIPLATYPNLLSEDLPALTVPVYLVSHGHDALQARFGAAVCQQPAFEPRAALAPGWQRSILFEQGMQACREGTPPRPARCTSEDRVLGLCH